MGKSSKKKPTNRERDFALSSHANAINGLQAQVSELFQLLASYIECKGDTDELTNFLTKKAEEKAKKEHTPKIVDSSGKSIASNG